MVVWASAAISLDGYIDDTTSQRLVLSGAEDWQQVRALRADCDAILIGAETLRKDNPALVTRDPVLREARIRAGKTPDPIKVTVTATGRIDPHARFFTEGTGEKIVLTAPAIDPELLQKLQTVATVVVSAEPLTPGIILKMLASRGIRSLFIEGGTRILTSFLAAGAVDFLRLAVAPFFVGESSAPRFVHEARFPHDKNRRMLLRGVSAAGDMAVLEYALRASADDYRYMEQAIALAAQCPPSDTAYSVGAVIVTGDRTVFTGYSRETAPANHAEEEAILKAEQAGCSLAGATIYSSMEPCSTRKSKPASCSELVIRHGIGRVVFAAYEPSAFVECRGDQVLSDHGVETVVLHDLGAKALEVNAHILQR